MVFVVGSEGPKVQVVLERSGLRRKLGFNGVTACLGKPDWNGDERGSKAERIVPCTSFESSARVVILSE